MSHPRPLHNLQPLHNLLALRQIQRVATGREHGKQKASLGRPALADFIQGPHNLADGRLDLRVGRGLSQHAAVEMDLAGPMERVVGGDHLHRVPAVGGLVAAGLLLAVWTPWVAVSAGLLKLEFEPFGFGDGGRGGEPVPTDVGAGVDAFAVAAAGELGDLGKDTDAPASEAHDAVDLEGVLFFVFGVVCGPVVATEERLVVFPAAEAAEDVEVGEPATQEVGDAVLAVDGAGSAASEHSTGHFQVVLPGYRDFEGIWGDDFEGG